MRRSARLQQQQQQKEEEDETSSSRGLPSSPSDAAAAAAGAAATRTGAAWMEPALSGLYGALASVAGKLALSSGSPVSALCAAEFGTAAPWAVPPGYCAALQVGCRAVLFGAMLGCNGLMLSTFLMALEKRGTLIVVVISSTCNMLASGLLGQLLFGEPVHLSWCVGASLMCLGVGLVAFSQHDTSKKPPG